MTDKELIQALRCCNEKGGWCSDCPRKEYGEELLDCVTHVNNEAIDRLEALLAENEHLREVTKMVPQWVSVTERLPEEDCCVVALDRGMIAATGYYDGVWHGMFNHDAVTHWMPLPEPPSTEGGGVNG